MIQECKFNPDVDIQETVPSMSTDLRSALENGVVVDTGTVGEFNDIQDPTAIWVRVNDTFQAIDAAVAARKLGAKSSAAAGGSAAVSPAESTPAAKSE